MEKRHSDRRLSDHAKAVAVGASVEVSRLQHGWLTAMGVDVPWIAVRPESHQATQSDAPMTTPAQLPGSKGLTVSLADVAQVPVLEVSSVPRVPQVATVTTATDTAVKGPAQEGASAWADVAELSLAELSQMVTTCKNCGLCETRQRAVAGDGVINPTILIVGEAPGEQEDVQGKPFVGRSGQLLDNMLKAIGHGRQTTAYITNVVKCRPPANRNPREEEITACAGYLERQLQLLKPAVILAMGRFAAHALLKTDQPLQTLRQTDQSLRVGEQAIPVVVTYHPAYLLRRPVDKRLAWEDLKRMQRLLSARS